VTPLRVLIGCEESGTMRRAFAARGHDAWSCDLQPARDGSNQHIIGDLRDQLQAGLWDLLVVCHPPCTRLCRAGGHWLYGKGGAHPKKLPKGRSWGSMIEEFEGGVALFQACLDAPIERIAVENPVMHIHAKAAIRNLPTPQLVQPWWFGDPAFKATGWHLINLPQLQPTDKLTPPARGTAEFKTWSAIHRAPPGPDRTKIRSTTFAGMAEACADQWGGWAEWMERVA
jgi:hypothetical protein